METQNMKHLMYVPFTGLGLYGGSRGKKWLRNRIEIFKQFVVPSLLAQTNQNFSIWLSFRPEDRSNKDIYYLASHLQTLFEDRVIVTFSGICFYDDKFEDTEARERLAMSLHNSMPTLMEHIGDTKDVIFTIQPSDDCYKSTMVDEMQMLFANTDYQAIGYKHGYIMSYPTGEVREYNPETNPPFVSVRMPLSIFVDVPRHMAYTALKVDVGKYKKGCPVPSHEYYEHCMKYLQLPKRGFLVGCHGENISTHFNLPYAGQQVSRDVLKDYGILNVPNLKIQFSLRKRILRKLPHRIQRKLRYLIGEKIIQPIYKLIHIS